MSGLALTGGFVNYYLAQVTHPQRKDQVPYQAECEDIIRALGMTFDEGCEFKAIWRTAAARLGNGKPGQKEVYDCEKRVHYANASLRDALVRQKVEQAEGWLQNLTGKPPGPMDRNVEVILFDKTHHEKGTNIGQYCWTLGETSSIEYYRFKD